jgi:hypothetical protein
MIKFIIAYKNGRLHHKKSDNPFIFHLGLARQYNFDFYSDVIESGIIEDKHIVLVECKHKAHLLRHKQREIDSYIELTKAREAQTRSAYNKNLTYILREGD